VRHENCSRPIGAGQSRHSEEDSMKSVKALAATAVLWGVAVAVPSVQAQPVAAGGGTDVYHVHFTKAAPGQAAALGKALMVPDPNAPMPDHFVVLRHQEGDDWDYAVIQHLGPKASVVATPPAPAPGRDLRAWHNDTFVSGPPWAEFTKAMGIGTAAAVYTIGVHRPAPGQRDALQKALSQPAATSSKIETGSVLLQHLEGADWTFVAITRYNSWQDFATDRAAAAGADQAGWDTIRQYSAFHRDTIADRVFPK
jgi:hypothetical protein